MDRSRIHLMDQASNSRLTVRVVVARDKSRR